MLRTRSLALASREAVKSVWIGDREVAVRSAADDGEMRLKWGGFLV